MNRDIHITVVPSEDDPADCSADDCSGEEPTDALTVVVTVITLGVAEIVTTLLLITVSFIGDCAAVLMTVVVDVVVLVSVVENSTVVVFADTTIVNEVAIVAQAD